MKYFLVVIFLLMEFILTVSAKSLFLKGAGFDRYIFNNYPEVRSLNIILTEKERYMKVKDKMAEFNGLFKEKSPLLLAFFLTIIIAIPIDILCKLFRIENAEEVKAIASFIKVVPIKELAFQLLIIAPLTQEFLYRGPVRLLILLFPKILTVGLAGKIIAWIFIIIPTYYWAMIEGGGHALPLDAFFIGLIFGWSVLKTKTLESAVLLHIFYNAINLIGALIKFRVL